MKKHQTKNKILKFLGISTLTLVMAPMIFGFYLNPSIKTTEVLGTVKQIGTYTIFDKNLIGESSNEYKSTLTLKVTNNLNKITDEVSNAPLMSNALAFYGTIDFSNASKKEEMKSASEIIVQSHLVAKGFRATILPSTSSGDSALASGVGSVVNLGWLNEDVNDYKVSFVSYVPSFDSFYSFNINYATNGDFLSANSNQIISSNINKVSVGKAGTNFDQYTKIVTPFTIVSWNISNWQQVDGSYDGVNASLYVDPNSYGFLKAWEAASNPILSGGLFVTTKTDEKYIIDLGNISPSSSTNPNENNLINLSFGPGKFAITDTFLYNEKNPTWNTTVTNPVDLIDSTILPYFTIKINGILPVWPGIQLANPVNITGLDTIVKTDPSSNNNNGKIEIRDTLKVNLVNTYSNPTSIVATIKSRKTTSTIKRELSSNPVSIPAKLEGLGVGFYNIYFELFNNNISLSPTILKLKNGNLDNVDVITPLARLSTSFGTNNTNLISEISFLSKSVDSKTSLLNLEKSKLNIYYDGELIKKESFILQSQNPLQAVNVLSYKSTHLIDSNVEKNLSLFSYNADLFYDVKEGTNITTKKMDSNLVFETNSTVSTKLSSSNTGLSSGIITWIIIGSIVTLGLIIWITSLKYKKPKI